MPRRIYFILIAAVILFGLLFVLSLFDREKPVKPMEAPVTGAVAAPAAAK